MRRRSKYGATRTTVGERTYDSKAEASFAQRLEYERLAGKVSYWLEQVPFQLPGGVKYRVDFQVFYADGGVRYFDVKGFVTKVFTLKKKQVEELYPVMIEVVK